MKLLLLIMLSTAIALLVMISDLRAEFMAETVISGGYQDNLFSDSNSIGDEYSSIAAEVKYYPSASMQVSAGARYNAFASYGDLSNINGNLSVSIIPTPETSPISLALTGGLALRKFGLLYESYDQTNASAGVGFTYRPLSWVHLHTSLYYLNNSYTNSDFGSNYGIDLATGINLTVLGSNTFALRLDYSSRSFDQPTLEEENSGNSPANDRSKSEMFAITGILIRYSRPLGERTGLNLSAGYRRLHLDNNFTALGYSIDYLSPWSDLWEGSSFSGGLKHFFPRQITTELVFAYFDKSYADVTELGEVTDETYWQDTRDDQLTTLSFSISRPVSLQNGNLFFPSLQLAHKTNNSSLEYFNYKDFQVSFALKFVL